MLELINIKKKYNKVTVLNNISLKFPDHGLVSIVGESGSGKSTLLNIIGLLERSDEGSILIDGRNTKELKNKDIDNIHKNYISFIFQQYNLIENMSVIDNITITNDNKDIYSIINMLKIRHLLTKKVSKLSGGEKQRVALARALSFNPKILLADEPTGALDSKNRNIVMELLKSISNDILVIMVTHNYRDAIKYSDRIIEIKDGSIIKDNNMKNIKCVNNFNVINKRIGIFKLLKVSFNNIKAKLKRNIITSIAFSIGLIALLLVLTISMGFKNSLDDFEKNTMSEYPLIISKSSTNLESDLENLLEESIDDKKVHSRKYSIVNKIDDNLVKSLNNLDNYLKYKIYDFETDNLYKSISDNLYGEFTLIAGSKIKNKNDVLIVIDDKNSIDSFYLDNMGLSEEIYDYKDLVGYKYNDKKIVGILKAHNNSVFTGSNFLFKIYDGSIPNTIYLYPKDYNNKMEIIEYLNREKISFTDYSSSIKGISDGIIKAISIILICFSSISLVVSTIMIGIITYINIVEKTKEIGILRSLGFSKKDVRFIFLFESISIGVIGSLISILVVLLLGIPINNLLFGMTGIDNIFVLKFSSLLFILLLSVFLCTIGSRIPLRGISRMNIIDTIKYE